MKKYARIGLLLSSLFIPFFIGCQEMGKDYSKREIEYPPPERVNLQPIPGEYKITQTEVLGKKHDILLRPRVVFWHDIFPTENRKVDRMLIWDGHTHYVFADFNCDNIVDEIFLPDVYRRGEPGTEEVFANADDIFAKWKKELHEKSVPLR